MTITIKKDGIYGEEIKKSRFICQLARVKSEEEAQNFIAQVKKANPRANHNCWAYTIGDRQEIQRMSDDGEPSGTAGVPMLEILKKKEITNSCAVVTRYFGGIKLGAGGLIRAYAGAVNHALEAVGLVKLVEQQEMILRLDYSLYDSLQRFLTQENLVIVEAEFLTEIKVSAYIDKNRADSFLSALTEHFNGKIIADKGQIKLTEVDFTDKL
ncbi:MAG: YigZ family protein [Streptococcaceae bacterium]|nr:YigZ family protein [Streptococcaceae bacterium]